MRATKLLDRKASTMSQVTPGRAAPCAREELLAGSQRLGQSAAVASDGQPVVAVAGAEERFDLVISADGLRAIPAQGWGWIAASGTPVTPPGTA